MRCIKRRLRASVEDNVGKGRQLSSPTADRFVVDRGTLTLLSSGRKVQTCKATYSACVSQTPIDREAVGGRLETPLFHYVIVRGDLPRGLQAAQIIHAAGESSPGGLSSGTHAVCLVVPKEAELLDVAKRLALANVKHVCIREPDHPWNDQLMALGVAPGRKEELKRYLSSIPLLK